VRTGRREPRSGEPGGGGDGSGGAFMRQRWRAARCQPGGRVVVCWRRIGRVVGKGARGLTAGAEHPATRTCPGVRHPDFSWADSPGLFHRRRVRLRREEAFPFSRLPPTRWFFAVLRPRLGPPHPARVAAGPAGLVVPDPGRSATDRRAVSRSPGRRGAGVRRRPAGPVARGRRARCARVQTSVRARAGAIPTERRFVRRSPGGLGLQIWVRL
jgi:hypothetical protein